MDMARYGSKMKHTQSSVNAVQQHKPQQHRRLVKPKSASQVYSDLNATVVIVNIQHMHAVSRMLQL